MAALSPHVSSETFSNYHTYLIVDQTACLIGAEILQFVMTGMEH